MLSVLLRMVTIGLMLSMANAFSANDIASSPINYLISAQVKPNIFFILDDSGSMQWSYLGDEVVINGYEKTIGYRNSLCNKIYYNPSVVYEPPEQADGTACPPQNFTAALYDGFKSDSIAVDLSTSFTAWRTATSSLPVPTNPSTITYHGDCSTNSDVYIIAPPASTQNFGAPVVDQYVKIDVNVESFITISRSGGSSNSLADVASYYFLTDLRQPAFSNCPTERDVCTNNVGVLRVVSNVPDQVACRPTAQSWIYEFDYLTGSYLPLATRQVVARKISDSTLTAGMRTIKLGEKILGLLTDETGKVTNVSSAAPATTVNAVKRVSWRELDEQ